MPALPRTAAAGPGETVRAGSAGAVEGTNISWPPLSTPQQEEMDGAIVMFQEAMDQVSAALGVARWCHADFALTTHSLCSTTRPC